MTDHINFNSNKENSSLKRTNFFISVAYLSLQVLIPGALIFFLTGKDFSFSYHLSLGLMVVVALSLIIFAILTTFVTYKCKLHQLDQFTYVMPFVGFILSFYLTSYWLDYNYFLIRFIIAFACTVVSIFITSVVLVLIIRRKPEIE